MRRTHLALAAALLLLLLPGTALADPPDPVHGLGPEVVELFEQPMNKNGQPTGPPVQVPASEHRPDQVDQAAGPRPRVQAVPGCKNVWARLTKRSPLGFTLYTFEHRAYFCWNSVNTITSLTRSVIPTPVDAVWHYGGLNASNGYWYAWCCGRTNTGHYGMRRGYFYAQIFPGAPISGRSYPTVEIWVHGNGTWTYGGYST